MRWHFFHDWAGWTAVGPLREVKTYLGQDLRWRERSSIVGYLYHNTCKTCGKVKSRSVHN